MVEHIKHRGEFEKQYMLRKEVDVEVLNANYVHCQSSHKLVIIAVKQLHFWRHLSVWSIDLCNRLRTLLIALFVLKMVYIICYAWKLILP